VWSSWRDALRVPCVRCPGSIVPARAGVVVLTKTPHEPRWRWVLPVRHLLQGWLLPWAARSKSPPLFTISNPTPCFSGADPPCLGSLATGLPNPSRGHRFLPRAMENIYDFLTFIQLFGSKKRARHHAQTCLCINSGDCAGGAGAASAGRQWGPSLPSRVSPLLLGTQHGVPGSVTQSPPDGDANILVLFKKKPPPLKQVAPPESSAGGTWCVGTQTGRVGTAIARLGTRHGSHAGRRGWVGILWWHGCPLPRREDWGLSPPLLPIPSAPVPGQLPPRGDPGKPHGSHPSSRSPLSKCPEMGSCSFFSSPSPPSTLQAAAILSRFQHETSGQAQFGGAEGPKPAFRGAHASPGASNETPSPFTDPVSKPAPNYH